MQFQSRALTPAQDYERKVEVALETGNYDAARSLIEQYGDEFPEQTHSLRATIAARFNVIL